MSSYEYSFPPPSFVPVSFLVSFRYFVLLPSFFVFSAFLLTLLFLLFLFSSLLFPVLYRCCCDVGSARHASCGRQPAIQTVYLLQSVDLALSEAAFSGSILCAAVCHVSYCAKPLCIIESCCAPSRVSAEPCRGPPPRTPPTVSLR